MTAFAGGRPLGDAYGRILLDMSALRRAAQESRVPLRQLEQGLEGAGEAAQATARSSEELAGKMDRLKGQINLQQRALQILENELEATAQKYGAASTQAQKKQLALDRLLQSIENNKQKLQELEQGLDRSANAYQRAGAAAERSGESLRRTGDDAERAGSGIRRAGADAEAAEGGLGGLEGAVGGVTGALGALGIGLGAVEIIQFGRDAIAAANEVEKSEAILREVAGTAERYAEVMELARENQLLFGGSLNEQLGGMRGIVMMSERYGASMRELTETFRLLNVVSPEQGIDGATVALKEFLSAADASGANSLAMRFEMDKGVLKEIIKTTPDATERLKLLREEMERMGVTSALLDSMLNTTANTYDRLGVAIEGVTLKTGSLLAKGFEPTAEGATRLLTGDLGTAGQALGQTVQQAGVGAARLLGFQGGLGAATMSLGITGRSGGSAGGSWDDRNPEDAAAAEERLAAATRERALAQARAAGDVGEALKLMREQAKLGADDVEELEKALDKALEGGAKAFREALGSQKGFLEEREGAQAEHTAKLAELEAEYTTKLNELLERRKEATTAKQRESLNEQIADLKQSHADRKTAEAAAFAEREQGAAEAYAREQAAQLAHLGMMLMQYATAQAKMAGLASEKIAEMTAAIAAEYGVQVSLTDRAFGDMAGAIDRWVASGGENATTHIADLNRIRSSTVELQQEVDRQIALMTENARTQFEAGKIDADEYAERLRRIPAAAEEVARSLAGIPTRINLSVETRQALNDQRAGERNATPPPPRPGPPRALGGRVLPNSIQEVAENERPELLQMGRKTFLLMGSRGGNVIPADGLGRGGLAELPSGALSRSGARLQGLGGMGEMLRAAGSAEGSRELPAGTLGRGSLQVAPTIVINGAVIDNEARLQGLADTITRRVVETTEGLFAQAVDSLSLSGVRG